MRNIWLQEEERATLEECYENHPKSHVRKRAQALLLSNKNWTVKQIAALHQTRTRTIYSWFDRWEARGVIGLLISLGRGRKPKLSVEDEEVVEIVKKKSGSSHEVSSDLPKSLARN